ncbi:MAG: M20/M25/M40 family metallo-hydrolase [Vicinamibacterales bacterium]
MKILVRFRIALCLATFASPALLVGPVAHQTAQTAAATVDVEALMTDVRTLSAPEFEGRRTGTEGNRRAQAYVLRRFREIGLEPIGETHEQKFSFTPRARGSAGAADKASELQGTNLLGVVRGTAAPDQFVVVSAHFDHLGRRDGSLYPGADDNASGVAGILAVASWFVRHKPERSLMVVAFDAEELGLQGARHFVKNPPVDLKQIVTDVNLDMIGRGGANTVWVAGTHQYPALKAPVLEASRGRQIKVEFGHDRPKAESNGQEDWTNSSDHGPFHAAGIPFLYFGVEDHPDYHKPTDTADKIPQPFFAEAVALAIDVVERLAKRSRP